MFVASKTMVEAQKKVKDKSWWYCNTHSASVGWKHPSLSRFNHRVRQKLGERHLEEMRRATWEIPPNDVNKRIIELNGEMSIATFD